MAALSPAAASTARNARDRNCEPRSEWTTTVPEGCRRAIAARSAEVASFAVIRSSIA
jgi:hypothetical protein